MQRTGKPYTDIQLILKCLVRTFKFIKEFAFDIPSDPSTVYFLTQYGCRSRRIALMCHNSTVYSIGCYHCRANVEVIVEIELAMSFLTFPLFTILV